MRSIASGRIPSPITLFVDRVEEVAGVSGLIGLAETRWVTLIGPPGCGKTRIAIEVARAADRQRIRRVRWVDLAPLTRTADVLPEIAEAVGLQAATGETAQPLVERLIELFAIGTWLLVLDNLEHVAEAAIEIATVQRFAPNLTILATSRDPARIHGEQRFPIPPLPLEPSESVDGQTPESAASDLFLRRARLITPNFRPDATDRERIRTICRRVDGLPLAIELAAGMLESTSLENLVRIVSTSQGVLSSGAIDATARHRSLTAAFDWSYQQLSAPDQCLFRRLAVYPGTFTLASVAALAPDGLNAAQALQRLDHASLIQPAKQGGAKGWVMLQTTRAYAADRAAQTGDDLIAAAAIARWCLDLAERRASAAFTIRQDKALDELDRHRPTMVGAFNWFRRTGQTEHFAQLAGALRTYWYLRAHYAEGLSWLEEALGLRERYGDAVHGRLLQGIAMIHLAQGRMQPALDLFLEAEPMLLAGGARASEIAIGRLGASTAAFNLHDHALATSLLNLANDAVRDQDPEFSESLAIASDANFAFLTGIRGDLNGARALFTRAGERQEQTGVTWYLAIAWLQRGSVEEFHGQFDLAIEAYLRSWRISLETHRDIRLVADAVAGLMSVALKRGDAPRAALLLGAEELLRIRIGGPIASITSLYDHHDATRARVQSALDPEIYERLVATGASLDAPELEKVVNAIGDPAPVEATAPSGTPRTETRKTQVMRLLQQGYTDRQMAEELGIGTRSVNDLIRALIAQHRVRNRAALAAIAARSIDGRKDLT